MQSPAQMLSARRHVLSRMVGCFAIACIVTGTSAITGAGARVGTSSGSPIVVMTVGDFGANPEWPGAVRARFQVVNARAGVKDAAGVRHRVHVVVCDTQFDDAATRACAQEAVSRKVAAVVGMSVTYGDDVWPILEAADIPVIGARINAQSDVTHAVSFPLGSGVVGVFSAMPQLLAKEGAHRVAVIMSDFGEASTNIQTLVAAGLARSGADAGPVVRIPLGVTDLEPYATEAVAGGVDGLIVAVTGAAEAPLLQLIDEAGYRGKVVVPIASASRLATALGDAADGTLLVGEFAPLTLHPVRGLELFRADLLRYGGLTVNEGTVDFWLAARVFERVAAGLPQIDAGSMLQALGNVRGLDMGGITPRYSASATYAAFPRLFNPTVRLDRISRGAIVPASTEFFDPFVPLVH